MPDLFGNEDAFTASSAPAAVALSLFDAAAESLAYENGRNVVQVRSEIVFGSFAHDAQTCRACGVAFFAAARPDKTCNLCRRIAGRALEATPKECVFECLTCGEEFRSAQAHPVKCELVPP